MATKTITTDEKVPAIQPQAVPGTGTELTAKEMLASLGKKKKSAGGESKYSYIVDKAPTMQVGDVESWKPATTVQGQANITTEVNTAAKNIRDALSKRYPKEFFVTVYPKKSECGGNYTHVVVTRVNTPEQAAPIYAADQIKKSETAFVQATNYLDKSKTHWAKADSIMVKVEGRDPKPYPFTLSTGTPLLPAPEVQGD